MNSEKTGLSEKEIIETLFNFIKQHFDEFGHHPDGNTKWWHHTRYGGSWAPFVEACFIIEGERRGYGKGDKIGEIGKIGHSYTHPNISTFMGVIHHPYGTDAYPKYPPRCYDISWVNEEGELILALEHEESTSRDNGSTAEKQLYAIFEELEKLRYYKGLFKIIVSRPHIRDEDDGIYKNVINDFKTNIQNKLSQLAIRPEENWIIILISPRNDIQEPNDTTEIEFHCCEWKTNKLDEIPLKEKSFPVKMENGGYIKRC